MGDIMKTPVSYKNERGVALVISLMFLALLSMLGTTAYVMTTTDLNIGRNYQASSKSFYDAEAGINFAISTMVAGLKTDPASFPSGGGTLDDMNIGDTTPFSHTTPNGFSFAVSAIEKIGSDLYSFTSTGTGGQNNSETVLEVRFMPEHPSFFNFGVFGDESVTFSGQGYTDSYNSSNGPWVSEGQHANSDVGTNAISANAITVSGGNAQVYGGAQIGPGGDTNTAISTHSSGQISGDKAVMDEDKDMTCESDPGGGTADTLNLTSWQTKSFSAGAYRLPDISIESHGICTINGDVTLYVDGNMSITGQGKIVISPGASLKIYISGDINPLAGQGVTNQTNLPSSLQIYGTSTCSTVNISGQADFYGAIYAPEADINLSGQGDVYGAICGDTIAITGQGSVHYDEALNNIKSGKVDDLQVVSWGQRYN